MITEQHTETTGTILEVLQRTHNVKSVRIVLSEEDIKPFEAGQYLFITDLSGLPCKKPLSISNSPTEKGYLEFTKKLTDSEFSQKLDSCKVGDTIKFKYPFGSFTYNESIKKIAFLSGGIGITPIRSMIKYLVDTLIPVSITLLYGNHSLKDIVFKEDFRFFCSCCSNLKVVNVLCEKADDYCDRIGYITPESIIEEIPDFTERVFYICGPPGMVKRMVEILSDELHLGNDQIVTEKFGGYQ